MTNAEKIKQMSLWDLAEYIFNVSNNAIKISVCENECTECEYSDNYCISEIAEWLMKDAEVWEGAEE